MLQSMGSQRFGHDRVTELTEWCIRASQVAQRIPDYVLSTLHTATHLTVITLLRGTIFIICISFLWLPQQITTNVGD